MRFTAIGRCNAAIRAKPDSLSGISVWPCTRLSAFHSVGPWRSRASFTEQRPGKVQTMPGGIADVDQRTGPFATGRSATSYVELHHDRHVIAGLLPATHFFQDPVRRQPALEAWAGPD